MIRKNDSRGLDFARAVIALAEAKGGIDHAIMIAEGTYGRDARPTAFLQKAAIAPASTQVDSWAGVLADEVTTEFIELVNEASVFGRIGLRKVPLNINLASLSAGATAYWRGETTPAPLSKGTTTSDTLQPLCVSALAAVSKEILRFGATGSESFIRAELVRVCAAAIDAAFLDPANGGSANVKPASVLDGVSAIGFGSDYDFAIKALIDDFGGDFETAYFVARPKTFVSLHDSLVRPLIGARGGELCGLPAIASRNVPDPAGGELLILIDGQAIATGDQGIEVSVSTETSIEMADDASGAAAQTSLWQAGLAAIKVDRHVNWAAMRDSVSYMSGLQLHDTSA
ncbi:phage major capsid protein [Hyphococcus sp.]|uniref:phage major capsid family protein n=1 Tax=Hyphococcus sp. TaxID=2038636 RepID=UPI003CCBBF71